MDNLCLVKAKYAFKANNNDELNFQKGDIITVTQQIEGGWWEGTLNNKTGWFPSNYVTEWKGATGNHMHLFSTFFSKPAITLSIQ